MTQTTKHAFLRWAQARLPSMRARAHLAGLMLGGVVLGTSLTACDDPADEVAEATVLAPRENEPTPPANEATAPGDVETLRFSNERSTIAFTGSKVTGTHEGGFNDFLGTIEFNAGDATASQIEVFIQTASLFADDERLTNHLKDEDFFNVEAYPQAGFRSSSIVAGGADGATHTITGTLSLHGKDNEISFPATVNVTESTVSAEASFSINRSDFGMIYPGMQDDLIRERVVIKLEIVAPRG